MQKKCFKCLEEKPLSEFYKHNGMADGHINKCKECNKKDVSDNYRKNIQHFKAYEKKRNKTPHRKERFSNASASFRASHPIQYAANMMVGNAVRDKRLIRPNQCSDCGIECIPDGHHNDYSRPLDVVWLCRQCHNNWHEKHKPLNGD